jgi:isocitrate/isopropylmalate dehydrogenase
VSDAAEEAVAATPTPDLGGTATTTEAGDAVLRSLERRLAEVAA